MTKRGPRNCLLVLQDRGHQTKTAQSNKSHMEQQIAGGSLLRWTEAEASNTAREDFHLADHVCVVQLGLPFDLVQVDEAVGLRACQCACESDICAGRVFNKCFEVFPNIC